jgi:thiamine biosynthesis protein ThiS
LEVNIQLYSILREKLPADARGRTTLKLEAGTTLADVLDMLEIKRRVVIGVNGEYEREHSRPVQDGDKLSIFSVVSGGLRPALNPFQCQGRLNNASWL